MLFIFENLKLEKRILIADGAVAVIQYLFLKGKKVVVKSNRSDRLAWSLAAGLQRCMEKTGGLSSKDTIGEIDGIDDNHTHRTICAQVTVQVESVFLLQVALSPWQHSQNWNAQ